MIGGQPITFNIISCACFESAEDLCDIAGCVVKIVSDHYKDTGKPSSSLRPRHCDANVTMMLPVRKDGLWPDVRTTVSVKCDAICRTKWDRGTFQIAERSLRAQESKNLLDHLRERDGKRSHRMTVGRLYLTFHDCCERELETKDLCTPLPGPR
jgi:hypothetical protein